MAKAVRCRSVGRVVLPLLTALSVWRPSAGLAQATSSTYPTDPAFAAGWQRGTPVEMTGELTILIADDFANRRAERLYFVKDRQSGRSYQVRFEREPTELRTGSIIRVSGRAAGSELYVLAAQTDSSGTTTPSTQTIVPAATSTSGDQRTLVIVANFRDATVACSNDSINDAMFADPAGLSVNSLYQDNSQGQLSLAGSVVGPYVLNASSNDSCNLSGWADAADAAAAAGGFDPAAYARKMYVMPLNTCPGAGFGTMGGAPSAAWVFMCDLKGIYAHEFGHNLGMDHAATPESEYNDTSDPMSMGSGALRGANAPHRQQLGWLAADGTQLATQDGYFDIAPLTSDPAMATSPRAVTIRKPDTGEYYYLSYRVAQGFDNYIGGIFIQRLSVHRYSGSGTPSKTFLLAELTDGESFADQANGITVTLVSHDSSRATARVQIANACVPAAPLISLSPELQSGPAGSTLTYALSVQNLDSATCAPSTFALNGAFPQGWTGSVSPATLTMDPGATAQAGVVVTSASGAAVATYQLVFNASDNATSVHTASVAGAYSVAVPCTPNVPAVVPSPSEQAGSAGATLTYTLVVTNRDSGGCPVSTFSLQSRLPAGWSGAPSPSAVSLAPGQSTTVILAVTSASDAAPASYQLSASTSDESGGVHSASADTTYTVQAAADVTAPTAPAGLTVDVNQKLKRLQLSWSAATDNVGVLGYLVWRNAAVVATVTGTNWSDAAYIAGATYTYSVSAYDGAGNASTPSNTVTITLAGGGGGKKR